MVAPSSMRTSALQGVRLTIVGDIFSIMTPQSITQAADSTPNAVEAEYILTTREEIENLILCHGGYICVIFLVQTAH